MSIKNTLKQILKNSLKDIYPLDLNEIIIEIPPHEINGDYSTNLPLVLTKKINKNPKEIANLIIENIEENEVIQDL